MKGDNTPNPENDAVERALRIAELQAELAALTGEPIAEHLAEGSEMDPEQAFFANMEALESGPTMPLADLLKRHRNFTPVPPEKINDTVELHEHLWLLLYALASMRIFFSCTNHLSDAELYQLLYYDVLQDEITILPDGAGWNTHFSMADATDERNGTNDCYLRFYADEMERDSIAEEFPDITLPPKEEPPYDRDNHLPAVT